MFTPFAFVKEAAAAGPSFPLTTAFIAAAGITGSANIQALQDFETGLTTYSLTSQMTAVYPLMGGNSTSTSYNFMDTTLYRITWNGTVEYSLDGVQTANAGGAYGDTGITGATLSVSGGHHCVDIQTNEGNNTRGCGLYGSDWGCGGDPSNPNLSQYYFSVDQGGAENALILAWPVNPSITANGGVKTAIPAVRNGIWIASRTSASNLVLYKNGSVHGSQTNTLTGRSYVTGLSTVRVLSRNTAGETSPRKQGFVTIGAGANKGLDATQAGNLNTLITNFQTTAGRI